MKALEVGAIRKILIFSWGLVVPAIVFNGYFGRYFSPMFSGGLEDGWCDPTTEGIGVHCFGDFADVFHRDASVPWDWQVAPLAHPPLPLFIQGLFRDLGDFGGFRREALILWLALLGLCLLSPLLWLWIVSGKSRVKEDFLLLGLGSTPAVFLLDRGNSLGLAIPVIVLVAHALYRGNQQLLVWAIPLAVALRPQLALLLLIFLSQRRIKDFIKAALITVSLFWSTFLLFPKNIFDNMSTWLRNTREFQAYFDIEKVPNLLSFARSITFVWQVLEEFGIRIPQFLESLPQHFSPQVLALPVLLIVVVLWLSGESVPVESRFLLLLILAISIPSSSGGYYSTYLLPAIALLWTRPDQSSLIVPPRFTSSTSLNRLGKSLYVGATICTLVPIGIPITLLLPSTGIEAVSLVQALTGLLWHLFLLYYLMGMAMGIRRTEHAIADVDQRSVRQ